VPLHSAATPVLSIWRPRAGEMIAAQDGGVVDIEVWGAFLPSAGARVGQSPRTASARAVSSACRLNPSLPKHAAGAPPARRLRADVIPDVEVELPCGGGAISVGLGASGKGAVSLLPSPQGGRVDLAALLVTHDDTGAPAVEALDRVSVYLPGAGEETCRRQQQLDPHHQARGSETPPAGGGGTALMARLSFPALALLLSDDPSVLSPPDEPTPKMVQLGLSWRLVALDAPAHVGWRCAGGCLDHALCLASMSR